MNAKAIIVVIVVVAASLGAVYFATRTIDESPAPAVTPATAKPPFTAASSPRTQPNAKKRIKPIVVKTTDILYQKPQSLEPNDWELYNKAVLEKLKAETSPELYQKIVNERKKRDNPEAAANLEKFNAEVQTLQKHLSVNPSDQEAQKRLRKMLDVQSKFKYLQELFKEN